MERWYRHTGRERRRATAALGRVVPAAEAEERVRRIEAEMAAPDFDPMGLGFMDRALAEFVALRRDSSSEESEGELKERSDDSETDEEQQACRRCGGTRFRIEAKQTRSIDEGSTIFRVCEGCGDRRRE